jgi:hypothetical protein
LTRDDLDERLQGYYDLNGVTIIRPEEEIQVDDMDFGTREISKMIDQGREIATRVLAQRNIFSSLTEAREKSEVLGSFTIGW